MAYIALYDMHAMRCDAVFLRAPIRWLGLDMLNHLDSKVGAKPVHQQNSTDLVIARLYR